MIPLTLVLLGMTAVVVLGLLLPLLHRWHAPAARRQYDRAVYRAQPSASSMTIGKTSPVVIPGEVTTLSLDVVIPGGGPPWAGVEGTAFPSPFVILSEATAGSEVEGPLPGDGSWVSNGFSSTP